MKYIEWGLLVTICAAIIICAMIYGDPAYAQGNTTITGNLTILGGDITIDGSGNMSITSLPEDTDADIDALLTHVQTFLVLLFLLGIAAIGFHSTNVIVLIVGGIVCVSALSALWTAGPTFGVGGVLLALAQIGTGAYFYFEREGGIQ